MLEHELWVRSQINSALVDRAAVQYACNALDDAELPLHPDRNKNWDSFLALYNTIRTTDFAAPILDAGAGDESAYLPGLKAMGYTNLLGINLDRHDDYKAGVKNGIRYAYGDITGTPFPNEIFAFVACLSVIEHGVDTLAFLCEMTRILKLGGYLFVSFDYWHDKLDTTGLVTHDAPINIFSEEEANYLIKHAAAVGLELVPPIGSSICKEKIITWAGLGYTFCNLFFRKTL